LQKKELTVIKINSKIFNIDIKNTLVKLKKAQNINKLYINNSSKQLLVIIVLF